MKRIILALVLSVGMLGVNSANADFIINIKGDISDPGSDFSFARVTNDITLMDFNITMAGNLVAGKTYGNADMVSISYRLFGDLSTTPTPSGFGGFGLVRPSTGVLTGAEFAALSPESSINFEISGAADLTNGLQVSELTGTSPVFTLNAREFEQDPGRYHPPILTLNSDGTGRIVNADNNSGSFTNPDPPFGSGLPVNVAIGEEYDNNLTFDQNLTLAIPEPGAAVILAGAFVTLVLLRRRK